MAFDLIHGVGVALGARQNYMIRSKRHLHISARLCAVLLISTLASCGLGATQIGPFRDEAELAYSDVINFNLGLLNGAALRNDDAGREAVLIVGRDLAFFLNANAETPDRRLRITADCDAQGKGTISYATLHGTQAENETQSALSCAAAEVIAVQIRSRQ